MFVSHDKLRGRMAEKKYSIRKLASVIGIHENTLSNKLYGKTYFSIDEVMQICKVLDITSEEIVPFFFMQN